MSQGNNRIVPLKLPSGRTLLASSVEYELVCGAARREKQSLEEWPRENDPQDPDDLRMKVKRERTR